MNHRLMGIVFFCFLVMFFGLANLIYVGVSEDLGMTQMSVNSVCPLPLGMGLRLYAALKINAHELVGKGGLTHS